MAKARFKGTFNQGEYLITISLSLSIWDEKEITFVYSPALDLTGYGTSEEEAKQSFQIMLDEFVNYAHKKKTIFDKLESLGWSVNRKKKRVHAPDLEELRTDNDAFRNLLKKSNVRSENQNVELALS